MAKRKKKLNAIGWMMLGIMAFGVFQFGVLEKSDRGAREQSATPDVIAQSHPASAPLSAPRFVNVASLNARHSPSMSGELIVALPRGTRLRVLDRQDGWLLVDLSPTLEGWVTERLTTTKRPTQPYRPPAPVTGSR